MLNKKIFALAIFIIFLSVSAVGASEDVNTDDVSSDVFAEADNPTVEVAYNESYSILGNQETENEQGESAKGSSEISISIDYGEFGDERSEDEVVNLHIPKTTLIDRGSFEITSDNAVLFSKELSTKEFYNGSDYYGYSVLFKDLNLNDVNGNALMEVNFNYNDGNPKKITKLAFLSSKDNIVSFNFLQTRDGDLWDDPVALLISDFPDGVDDEFIIFTDHFGEIINLKWKISELTRNEEGLYVWHCSGLGIPELLFYEVGDDDINLRIQFF